MSQVVEGLQKLFCCSPRRRSSANLPFLGEAPLNPFFEKLKGFISRRSTAYRDDVGEVFKEVSKMYTGAENTPPLDVLAAALGEESTEIQYLRNADHHGYLEEWRKTNWAALKKTHGDIMSQPDEYGISREGLRSVAVKCVQLLVNQIMIDSGTITSASWLQVGTVGYNSDIDTNMMKYERGPHYSGDTSTELMAKVLFDICWISIFSSTSGLQADTEVYTNIKTYEEPASRDRKASRDTADIQLAILQMRNLAPDLTKVVEEQSVSGGIVQEMVAGANAFVEANQKLVEAEITRMQIECNAEERRLATTKVQLPILFYLAEEQDAMARELEWLDAQLAETPYGNSRWRELRGRRDSIGTKHMLNSGLMATYFDESYFSNASFRSVVIGGQKVRSDSKQYHAKRMWQQTGIVPPEMSVSARRAALLENYAMWEKTVYKDGDPLELLVKASKYGQRVINEALYLQRGNQPVIRDETRKLLSMLPEIPDVSSFTDAQRALAQRARELSEGCSSLNTALSQLLAARTNEAFDQASMLVRQVIHDADEGFRLPVEIYYFQALIAIFEAAKRRVRIPTYEIAMSRLRTALAEAGVQLKPDTMSVLKLELQRRYQLLQNLHDFHHIIELESVPIPQLIELYLEWIEADHGDKPIDADAMDKLIRTLEEILGSKNIDLTPEEMMQMHTQVNASTPRDAADLRDAIRAYFARLSLETAEGLEHDLQTFPDDVRSMMKVSPIEAIRTPLEALTDEAS